MNARPACLPTRVAGSFRSRHVANLRSSIGENEPALRAACQFDRSTRMRHNGRPAAVRDLALHLLPQRASIPSVELETNDDSCTE